MMPSRNKYVTKAIRNFHQAGWFLMKASFDGTTKVDALLLPNLCLLGDFMWL